MNTKYKMVTILSSIVVVSFLLFPGKKNIGLAIDKLGFTQNSIQINVDKQISSKDLYVYWVSPTEYSSEQELNKMLIYHITLQANIPPSYGDNMFVIKYKDKTNNKIGLFKTHEYSKHKYEFDFKLADNNLIVNWSIKNWYDPDSLKGSITIEIQ